MADLMINFKNGRSEVLYLAGPRFRRRLEGNDFAYEVWDLEGSGSTRGAMQLVDQVLWKLSTVKGTDNQEKDEKQRQNDKTGLGMEKTVKDKAKSKPE
ncbi:hypothetical protein Tco_1455052, partial [Tanacetum coccineum]